MSANRAEYGPYRMRDYPPASYEPYLREPVYPRIAPEIREILLYTERRGLGDFVFLLPFLKTLKRCFPQSRITLLGQIPAYIRSLYDASGYFDDLVDYLPRKGWAAFADYAWLIKTLGRRRFDLIIDQQRRVVPSLAARLLRSRYRLGFAARGWLSTWRFAEPDRKLMHTAAQTMMLLRRLGADPGDYRPEFQVPDAFRRWAEEYLAARGLAGRALVGLVPGAGNSFKCWAPERFAALGRRLHGEDGLYPLIFLGPGEEELARRVLGDMGLGAAPGLEHPEVRDDLLYSAALMQRCAAVVGADCGGIHLATMAGTPAVAIYGPTVPDKFGPLGPGNYVVSARYECAPCRMGNCAMDRECLDVIDVDCVLAAVREAAGPGRRGAPVGRAERERPFHPE